jgi:cbb3-type cytochrome oxidase subunit 1
VAAATSTETDNAALGTTEAPDTAATSHLLVSTLFLALGGLLMVLAMAGISFPTIATGLLSPGRLRAAALLVVMLGWLVIALVGAGYYVLPRLTGTRLWRPDLAMLAMWAIAGLTVAGVVVVMLGLGDGVEPFLLPWWLDLPILAVLLVPALVTIQTLRRRSEQGVYVSLWFVAAGFVWLPMLYAVNMLPGLASVGRALQEVVFTAGFTTLWVTAMGVGVAYYVVVKVTGNPLSNRQLAKVGFWSLAVASIFAGPVQLAFGATPDWLDTVSAVLGLALPVAALANAYTIGTSIDRSWEEIDRHPSLAAIVAGLGFALFVAVTTSVASFSSAAAVVGFTSFWDGVTFAALFGVGGLLVAGWAYQALPAMSGRQLASVTQARRHIRWTVLGVGSTALFLIVAGVLRGYVWTGGAFTGSTAAGESWTNLAGAADVLVGLSVLGALLALAGQLTFVLNVYRTITSGRATAQEVLVERREA